MLLPGNSAVILHFILFLTGSIIHQPGYRQGCNSFVSRKYLMPKMERQKRQGGAAKPARNRVKKDNNDAKPPPKSTIHNKKLSHSLSWALRHQAVAIGLPIQPDGYVPVQEILDSKHPKLRGATLQQIQHVVETSDKQRFKLEVRPLRLFYPAVGGGAAAADDDTTILCIRANQGHSMNIIEPELLLTKLSPQELQSIPCIVHGTYPEPWKSIQQQGQSKRTRQHIHCASGLPNHDGVISGMRKSASIHIYINAKKCADDGIAFFKSDNGVLLTDGVNHSGILPVEYFSRVTDSSGNVLLDNRKQDINNDV